MREIKFRAWNGLQMLTDISGWFVEFDGQVWHNAGVSDDDVLITRDVRLMQYTGLKDAKGVEIYEGDIVELPHWEPSRWVIDYSNENAAFYFRHEVEQPYDTCNPMRYLDKAAVIGNIYENPELMEAK